jgi:curved DNA-binding protein
MSESYYQVLGVEPTADRRQLDAAYKRAAIHFYQCELGSKAAEPRFQLVTEAYAVLLDSELRRAYDASLTDGPLQTAEGA